MPLNPRHALLALLATASFAVAPAHAQKTAPPKTVTVQVVKPQPQPVEGLPMWVIRDADSTIYVTGTVHMLPDGLRWDSQKLVNAIKESKELWLELPMGSDPTKFAAEAAPVMIRYALNAGPPLSSRLTAEEMAALNAAIAKSGMPPQMTMAVNVLKPWYAAMVVGISPLISAGFDSTLGIDVKLAKMAEDDGDVIKGFETVEEQTKILASGSDEEQLEALRQALKMTDAQSKQAAAETETVFAAWAHGDISGVVDMFKKPDAESEFAGASMDAMLKNRNENWAGQIEMMLKGSGVAFVAVGAAHIVGPDNLIERLKLRGIEATRY